MKFFLAFLLSVLLLLAYWAWPFFGLRALSADLQARNAAALSEQVDFELLRRSLTGQIIATYLRITGRERKLGPLSPLVSAIGASIVDPWVSQIVNPENLIELLRGGTIQTELGATSFKTGIAEFLLEYRVESVVKQRIWTGQFFDWIACLCRSGRTVPPSNAAVRVELETDRSRPARKTTRSVRAGTGEEIPVNDDGHPSSTPAPSAARAAKLFTRDEARRIAANIGQTAEHMQSPDCLPTAKKC